MITEKNLSSLATAMSFDKDNESILSMTSSKHEEMVEEVERNLVGNSDTSRKSDSDEEDYIPASLSAFIANAEMEFTDLVSELDLPSSRNGSVNGDNEMEEEKSTLPDLTPMEYKASPGVFFTSDIEVKGKSFTFTPGSDIKTPKESNYADNFNTVNLAKIKALSPEITSSEIGVISNSITDLNHQLELEDAAMVSSDEAKPIVERAATELSIDENPTLQQTKLQSNFVEDDIDDNFLPNNKDVYEDEVTKFILFSENGNVMSMDLNDESSSDDEQFFPNRNTLISSVSNSSKGASSLGSSKIRKKENAPATRTVSSSSRRISITNKKVSKSTINTSTTNNRAKIIQNRPKDSTLCNNRLRRSSEAPNPTYTKSNSVKSGITSKVSSITKKIVSSQKKTVASRNISRNGMKPTATLSNSNVNQVTKRQTIQRNHSLNIPRKKEPITKQGTKNMNNHNMKRQTKIESSKFDSVHVIKKKEQSSNDKVVSKADISNRLESRSSNASTMPINVITVNSSKHASKIPEDVFVRKDNTEEKHDNGQCETATTDENTWGSDTSAENTKIDKEAREDTLESTQNLNDSKNTKSNVHNTKLFSKSRRKSIRSNINESVKKHMERIASARKKRISTGSIFDTPKPKNTQRGERSKSSRRISAPLPPRSVTYFHTPDLNKGAYGDPLQENPISTNWGSSTHEIERDEVGSPSPSKPLQLTTPLEPNLSTRSRNGDKNYSTSSLKSFNDSSTLGSLISTDGTRTKYTSQLTDVTFGESIDFVQRRGFRELPAEEIKWDSSRGVTVPDPPKLSDPKPKEIKSSEEIEEEIMKKGTFKARPVPPSTYKSGSHKGIPKIPSANLTTPEPFHLSESLPRRRSIAVTHLKTEEQELLECDNQFEARPLPCSTHRPPKAPSITKKIVTTPKPFKLRTETRRPSDGQKILSTEELDVVECANQFKAKPMPSPARFFPPNRNKSVKKLTTPKPFKLSSSLQNSKDSLKPPTTEERKAAECALQFQARPMPNSTYKPPQTHHSPQVLTTPKPFKFLSRHRNRNKVSPTISNDEVELSKKFQARPLPMMTYVGPKQHIVEHKEPTKFTPFNLRTDARFVDGGSKALTTEELEAVECVKQFQARPIPNMEYRPPKGPKMEKPLTTPEPFNFHIAGRSNESVASSMTDDDIELAKKFHARPLPDLTYKSFGNKPLPYTKSSISKAIRNGLEKLKEKRKGNKNKHSSNLSVSSIGSGSLTQVTLPSPFQLETDIRHKWYKSQLKEKLILEAEKENRNRMFKAITPPKFHLKKVFTPKHSKKELTVPVPFQLSSTPRHEMAQSLLKEKIKREKEEMKRRTSFTATPLPKGKKVFTPRRFSSCRTPLKAIEPNFQCKERAQQRSLFNKKVEQRKKTELAMKNLLAKEKEMEEMMKVREMRRKSISEGGLCFEAKTPKYLSNALQGKLKRTQLC